MTFIVVLSVPKMLVRALCLRCPWALKVAYINGVFLLSFFFLLTQKYIIVGVKGGVRMFMKAAILFLLGEEEEKKGC